MLKAFGQNNASMRRPDGHLIKLATLKKEATTYFVMRGIRACAVVPRQRACRAGIWR